MKLVPSLVVLLASLLAVPAAMARGPRDGHRPPPPPRSELRDDYRDLKKLESLLHDYDREMSRPRRDRIQRLDDQVLHLVRRELKETKQEIRQDLRNGDRRDARAGQRVERHVRDVAEDYRRLKGRVDRRSLSQKRDMISELMRIARHEVRRG